ncbi:MAG: hypothetical protein H0X33_12330 [Taibaiella sp.]|nr:hypothetical protein [Taibaiella sp.]
MSEKNSRSTQAGRKKPRRSTQVWKTPASVIANMVECHPDTVVKVRSGKIGKTDKILTQRIKIADMLVNDGKNNLLTKVKQLIKF